MAALLKNKDASERERLIISIADDATSPRPFDAAGWQADTPVAIVRGDGYIPLSASGHSRRFWYVGVMSGFEAISETPLSDLVG
jgi:hypothetical protein